MKYYLSFLYTIAFRKIARLLLAFSALWLAACTSSPEKQPEKKETTEATANSNLVAFTDAQFQQAGIALGHAEARNLSGVIRVNGILDVPPQSMISITAPLGGFVKKTELLEGMKIMKGQVLAVLENPEYIQLQQDYLDAKSKLNYQELELARQKTLSQENVTALKTLQQTTAQYQQLNNQVAALAEKLAMINVDPHKLTAKNISRSIRLYSPINGFVKSVQVNIGKYVTPQGVLFELVNTAHIHALLAVFEKDAAKLKEGQKIKLTFPSLPGREIGAAVFLTGRTLEADKTVRVHAHLDKTYPDLMPGMYVTALIEVSNHAATALPDEAIVQAEGRFAVFVAKGKRLFEMVPVKTGASENGFTEVKLPANVPANALFVTKGAYHVLAKKLNVGEEG